MQGTPRIIDRLDAPRVEYKINRDDPLNNQAIWCLNGIIGIARLDGGLAGAVISTMGLDGSAASLQAGDHARPVESGPGRALPGDLAAVQKAVASLHSDDEGEHGESGRTTYAELVRMLASELRVRTSGRPRALGFAR